MHELLSRIMAVLWIAFVFIVFIVASAAVVISFVDEIIDELHDEPTKTKSITVVENDSFSVYVTPSGECYHLEDCPTIAESEYSMATSRSDAKDHGYRPCEVCNPGE